MIGPVHELSDDQAAERARQAVGVAATIPANTWRVIRLDRPGEAYYLVILGDDQAPIGVAAIKADTGDVMGRVHLSGTRPHLVIDAPRASQIAKISNASAELVWQPCQASRSPLYPLWRVTDGERSVFVDQQEKCWDRLAFRSA
jgi:hypothetical protein